MPEHMKIWEQWQDKYLLGMLDAGLNRIPETECEFSDVTEEEINAWLKQQDFTQTPRPKFKIKVPTASSMCSRRQRVRKTETVILPLSLENNATLTGTADILEEFGQEFGIPCVHKSSYLPFDVRKGNFDIQSATQVD